MYRDQIVIIYPLYTATFIAEADVYYFSSASLPWKIGMLSFPENGLQILEVYTEKVY